MLSENLKATYKEPVLKIAFDNCNGENKINAKLVEQFTAVLAQYEHDTNVVVIEGNEKCFCTGADFQDHNDNYNPDELYQLWYKLATGSFITVSHVRGKVMAGGMGFLAASDVVIADEQASFCLSEMLFGLYPALVFPFLCRRIGFAKANYMTLSTMTMSVQDAAENGLVDVWGAKSSRLLAQHLGRLTKIPKESIISYKRYVQELNPVLKVSNDLAVKANLAMFQDAGNQKRINDFITFGKYPWES